MRAFTRNRGECRIFELIGCAGDQVERTGVAEETFARDLAREIEMLLPFVTGSDIPAVGLSIEGDRRLEEVIADAHEITMADESRAYRIRDPVARRYATALNAVL